MGLYDQALAINAQGQNAALGLRSAALNKPTAVERFMAGLRGGQERLEKQKATAMELLNKQAAQRTKDDQVKSSVYKTAFDVVNKAGGSVDPSKLTALLTSMLPVEAHGFVPEALQAVTAQNGQGGGYQQKERGLEANEKRTDAYVDSTGASADYIRGPKTAQLEAGTDLIRAKIPGAQVTSDMQKELTQSIVNRNNRPPVSNSAFNAVIPSEILPGMVEDVKRNPALINTLIPSRNVQGRQQLISEVYGGGNANLAGSGASYRADTGALSDIQKKISNLGSFERTTVRNMEEFAQSAKRINDTGYPILNKPLREIDRNVLGSVDQAKFDAWRSVHLPELARVIQSANASGVVTVHGQDMIEKINSGDATIPQILAVTKEMQRAVKYRVEELEKEAETLRGRTSSTGTGKLKGLLTPTSSGVKTTVKDGKTYYMWPDGNWHSKAPQ